MNYFGYQLFNCLRNLLKYRRVALGKLGKDFSIKFYFLFLQARHQRVIREAVRVGSRAYFCLPKFSEITLSVSPSVKRIGPGMQKSLAGQPLLGFSAPMESFGIFEKFLSFFMGDNAPFDSSHVTSL